MKCALARPEAAPVAPPVLPVRSGEHGFTLVEVLVAVVILGLAVVSILGGLATSIFGTDLHRSQSDLDAALVSAEEQIKAANYQPCVGTNPTGFPYTNAAGYTQIAIGSGSYSTYPNPSPTPSIGTGYFSIAVQYWNGGAWVTVTTSSGCLPAVPPTDDQLITITGISPNHRTSQTVSVVKGQWH